MGSYVELAEVFGRLVIDALIANDERPELIEKWATKAAHYGRQALNDAEQRQYAAIRGLASEMYYESAQWAQLAGGRR